MPRPRKPVDARRDRAIGAALRAAREDLGWSQADVAAALRLPRSIVSDIESGRRVLAAREYLVLRRLWGRDFLPTADDAH